MQLIISTLHNWLFYGVSEMLVKYCTLLVKFRKLYQHILTKNAPPPICKISYYKHIESCKISQCNIPISVKYRIDYHKNHYICY